MIGARTGGFLDVLEGLGLADPFADRASGCAGDLGDHVLRLGEAFAGTETLCALRGVGALGDQTSCEHAARVHQPAHLLQDAEFCEEVVVVEEGEPVAVSQAANPLQGRVCCPRRVRVRHGWGAGGVHGRSGGGGVAEACWPCRVAVRLG